MKANHKRLALDLFEAGWKESALFENIDDAQEWLLELERQDDQFWHLVSASTGCEMLLTDLSRRRVVDLVYRLILEDADL